MIAVLKEKFASLIVMGRSLLSCTAQFPLFLNGGISHGMSYSDCVPELRSYSRVAVMLGSVCGVNPPGHIEHHVPAVLGHLARLMLKQ